MLKASAIGLLFRLSIFNFYLYQYAGIGDELLN